MSAAAATYNVGPGRQYTQLTTFFNSVNLAPGDIVEVDGNASYAGNIVVGDDDSGTQASPVTIRWRRVARGDAAAAVRRHAYDQVPAIEPHRVRGLRGHRRLQFVHLQRGAQRHRAGRLRARLPVARHPRRGPELGIVHAGVQQESRRSGQGDRRHAIYMQSDEVTYPDAVFRMRYNYVHSATGGACWCECATSAPRSTTTGSRARTCTGRTDRPRLQKPRRRAGQRDLRREDAELVGQRHHPRSTSRSGNALRIGGDLNGAARDARGWWGNTI